MTNSNQTIVVIGATGNVGAPVVAALIEKGIAPRVVVRQQKPHPAWDAAGVTQIVADSNDVNSLAKAFEGASHVFSVLPLVENIVEMGEKTVTAAQKAGVQHLVRSSAQGADVSAPIALGRWHGEIDQKVESSGLDFTLLQPASFFQNYLGYADTIKTQNAFYAPMGDGKVSLIDTRDIAAVAVAALTQSGHAGKKYALTGGESLSNSEIAAIFSEVLGREISYVDVPEAKARQQMLDLGMPAWLVDAVMELNAIGKAGYLAQVSPSVEQITQRPPLTFRQFAEQNQAAFK